MIVRKGSFRVKIYFARNKRGYGSYYVSYYLGRVRKLVAFADLEKAKKEAKFVAAQLDKQEVDVLELHSTDRVAYQCARRYLDPRCRRDVGSCVSTGRRWSNFHGNSCWA